MSKSFEWKTQGHWMLEEPKAEAELRYIVNQLGPKQDGGFLAAAEAILSEGIQLHAEIVGIHPTILSYLITMARKGEER